MGLHAHIIRHGGHLFFKRQVNLSKKELVISKITPPAAAAAAVVRMFQQLLLLLLFLQGHKRLRFVLARAFDYFKQSAAHSARNVGGESSQQTSGMVSSVPAG